MLVVLYIRVVTGVRVHTKVENMAKSYDVQRDFVLQGRRVTRRFYKREHPMDISHFNRNLIRSMRARAEKCEGEPILFRSLVEEYGYLSNFAASNFELDGQVYNCVEQRYQSEKAKFCGRMDLYTRIMKLKLGRVGSGSQLRMLWLGREALEDRPDLRSEWDKKSVSVMFKAVSAKFSQNLDLKEKLKSTGLRPLGESTYHTVWGTGMSTEDQRAKDTSRWAFNLLGLVLIFVRYFLS